MSIRVEYEWTTEDREHFIDERGQVDFDIVILDYLDSLLDLVEPDFAGFDCHEKVLGLVRREILPDDSYGDYEYAYCSRVDGVLVLPESFGDAFGAPGHKIPARFHTALANAQRKAAAR